MAVVAVFSCLTFAAQGAAAQEATLPKNHISVGTGFPLPIGGLARLELLHRIDDRNFVKIGVGSVALISGLYLSYGRRFSADPDTAWYAYGGFENNMIAGIGGDLAYFPGLHAGLAKEWLTSGGWRIALGFAAGLPWLGGITFELGR